MIKIIVKSNTTSKSIIADENRTLRSILEEAGVDYSVGTTSLDGVSLPAGGIDKTFADYGVTEKCYLMNVAKVDNAAAIKIVGGVAVIESALKLEDIKKLAKYRPAALSLFEGTGKDKEEVFQIGAGRGYGSISTYGASFGGHTTTDGKATITIEIPEGTEDPKAYIADKVGVAILNLNKVEAQFEAANADIDQEIAAINANITVM